MSQWHLVTAYRLIQSTSGLQYLPSFNMTARSLSTIISCPVVFHVPAGKSTKLVYNVISMPSLFNMTNPLPLKQAMLIRCLPLQLWVVPSCWSALTL